MGVLLVALFALVAAAFTRHRGLRPYAFTVWVFAFVAASMAYPWAFGTWFGFDLRHLITPLVQIIMFGMGTTLSVRDFTRVLTMPWPVIVGVALQYTIMPFVGFGLAKAFGFEAEVAAGIVLIGSAPSGVASNVINYLARANVPLSVTLTALATLMSPVMTPLMMKLLAGQYIAVSFVKMMVDICNMILVPVIAGLVAHRILYGNVPRFRKAGPLGALGGLGLGLAVLVGLTPTAWLGALKSGLILGFSMLALTILAKLVVELWLKGPSTWMDRALPVVSMAGICFIIAIITARSSEDLKRVGLALLGAAMLHNLLGYLLGYYAARALRLSVVDARTVAVEVGMQNGGMASGLAMNTLQSAKAALAPAIFGPWMNVSGSILASYWRKRPAPGLPGETPNP